jgi:hypothetical protein
MEIMRRVAYGTVLRACGFGSLAIFCLMVGLSFEPRLAFQAGGFLTLGMTAILALRSPCGSALFCSRLSPREWRSR